jgi:hypothetical protein
VKAKKADVSFRLSPSAVASWLAARGWSIDHIRQGRKVWRTLDGFEPLTVERVEGAMAKDDMVHWSRLNLIEERDALDPDTGEVVIAKDSPWVLFEVQERMARLGGNCVFECGSEVGKTRDIVGRALWKVDTVPGSKVLIAAANQTVAEEIANAIDWQAAKNPAIGGGLRKKMQRAPFYQLAFSNDSEIQLRLVGAQGEQLRGFHGSDLLGDECALWRSVKCFTEFYRAGMPGSTVRLYSTPNGDRASAFAGICARARAVDGRPEDKDQSEAAAGEPGFVKMRIGKDQLPTPFWSESRRQHFLALYGGEAASAYQQNVFGAWGEPTVSIFPGSLLEPCLSRTLPGYRVVVAEVNRESARVKVRVARLSGTRTGAAEEIVANEEIPLLSDWDFGRFVGSFLPQIGDMVEPRLYAGVDLGSEKDPTELVIARVEGPRWTDLFRLHLADATWETQVAVFAALDCVSTHRIRYGVDAGSAGGFLVQRLVGRDFATCPLCRQESHLSERFFGFNFGEVTDATDPDTGEPVVDPEKKDNAGRPLPRRLSRKEHATRILEAKVQRRELVLADDDGAGDSRLGVSALLRGVSQVGVTSRGERRFDGRNDHHVDARRQMALVIAKDARDGFGGGSWVPATPDVIASIPGTRSRDIFDEGSTFRRSAATRFGGDW